MGNTARLTASAKIGKLVNQALNKAWEAENEETMDIVKNMVKWGNFVSVWKFYSKYSAYYIWKQLFNFCVVALKRN